MVMKETIIVKRVCSQCKHFRVWDDNITDCYLGRTIEHRKAQGGLTTCQFWEAKHQAEKPH